MEGDHIKICHWLTPLSWLYGLGVGVRNLLFDCGVLHSESFDVPVICVGNITAGGTGKTPHTEYLVRLLSQKHQTAVLSRGYKRKTSGYVLATAETPMRDIGDEPFQMKRKFPSTLVAVDKNRCRGIRQLCAETVQPPVDVILLDDAFQHRYVSPGVSILLMDYHRLIYFDKLLPAGRLREPASSRQRADIVIVTKCPDTITPMEERGIARSLQLQPWQKLFFTTFRYSHLQPFGTDQQLPLSSLKESGKHVLLLTGIASPQQMEYDLKQYCDFTPIHFSDHHNFSARDLQQVEQTFVQLCQKHGAERVMVVTTEKDAARLTACNTQKFTFADQLYTLPVRVDFLDDSASEFNQTILDYVQKNSRNSTLLSRKNAHKA